ncbi:MAG: hypothetical protein AB7H77_07570 [Bdellovibrionales bacterium]
MVDSIHNSGSQISTLLRAQSAAATGESAQRLTKQNANGARPVTVQPAVRLAGVSGDTPLPRGSIVDIIA